MFNVYKSNEERLRYNQLKAHQNFFKLINSKTVQCKCGKQVKLDKTYRVKNLETHASGSGCLFQNSTNKRQFSILNFVKRPLEIDENIPVQISPISCQDLNDDKYLDYILLTPTQYGGGKRDYIVAYNLFPNKFSGRKGFSRNKLTPEEKIIWRRELLLTFKWRIDKDLKAIFSMNCERKIRHPSGICINCQAIRDNAHFKRALIEFTKTLQNANLEKIYRSSVDAELGQKGAFNSNKTFTKLVNLMIKLKNLEERGKKKNGLRYSEHLLHFFSLLSENSRIYSIFKNAFGGMSLQHIRDQDIFTSPDLSFENIMQFAKIANDYHWKGPVILITDCTKLQPKVVYYQEFGTIMGSVLSSDQTKVSTYEDIHATMKLIRENDAVANQIRGFIIKIPISKIPPVIIAAIPTKGNTKADKISQLLLDIINMTACAEINLLSIGADGAISEMKAQEK
ncbi:2561_t:CDS:2 [Rhizophagus irregularis]|nr:2561_t:CDS:2 [Rhizophagus irregularis]